MIGEFHCLNCGRHLADLILGADGRVELTHPAGQEHRPVLAAVRRDGVHCVRCGGRALFERPLGSDVRPNSVARAA